MTEDDLMSMGEGMYGLKTPCSHCFHVNCLTHWAALSIVQKENKVPTASWITEQGRTQNSIKNLHGQLKSAELDRKNLLEQKEKCDLEIEQTKKELAKIQQNEVEGKAPINKKEKDNLQKDKEKEKEKENSKTKIVEKKVVDKKKKKDKDKEVEQVAIEETELEVETGIEIGITADPKELQKLLEKLKIESDNSSDKLKRMEKR